MWRFWMVSTFGPRRREVFPVSGRWRTIANGVGDGEHTFRLNDQDTKLPPEMWRGITIPWGMTLVVCWDDIPVYAGLIMRHQWSDETRKLTVTHKELRAIATRRMLYGVGPYDPNATITIGGKSNRGLARAYVFYALINGGERWVLPVALPEDELGDLGDSIERWRFRTLEDLLRSVQEAVGGPDIHLQPRWSTSGSLEWVLRLGAPRLTGPSVSVNVSAPESPVVGFMQTTDGAQQLTGLWGLGNGSGADMLVSAQPLPEGSPVPFLDTTRPFKDINEQGRLDTLTLEMLRSSREPSVRWSFDLKGTQWPAKVGVGSSVTWHHSGNEFVERTPDGGRVSYVVGVSGDMSDRLGLEML